MGQAKKRGDFETRKSQAVAKQQALREEATRKYYEDKAESERLQKEWWDSLTPQQKEAEAMAFARRQEERRWARNTIPMLGAMAAMAAMGGMR